MFKPLLLFFIFVLGTFVSVAQNQQDPIESYKSFGTIYAQNDKKLNVRKLLVVTKNNPEAYALMKKAQSNNTIGSIIGGAGGFLLGYQLGAALGGGEANWTAFGIGAGLVAVSVPFSIKFGKQTKEAVGLYNESVQGVSQNHSNFIFYAKPNAVGVAWKL